MTTLHLALSRFGFDSVNVVKVVVEASAGSIDIDIRDSFHRTPLHWAAACNCDAEVVQLLLSKGADVRAVDKLQETPLHLAVCNLFSSDAKVVQILLDNGADVNAIEKHQRTPLHMAAEQNEKAEVISALIKAGADVVALDKFQKTPIHYAAGNYKDSLQVVNALLEAGASVNLLDKDQRSPLFHAACAAIKATSICSTGRSKETIRALLNAGADPHIGQSPLDTKKVDSDVKLMIKEPYLIFVIFFTHSNFLENKIYTEKRQFFALNL